MAIKKHKRVFFNKPLTYDMFGEQISRQTLSARKKNGLTFDVLKRHRKIPRSVADGVALFEIIYKEIDRGDLHEIFGSEIYLELVDRKVIEPKRSGNDYLFATVLFLEEISSLIHPMLRHFLEEEVKTYLSELNVNHSIKTIMTYESTKQ